MIDADLRNKWETFREVFGLLGQFCHLMCPPIPELVTRKLAFHPPPKGTTYKILSKNGEEVTSAKQLRGGQEFQIQLVSEMSPREHAELMKTVEPFILTTKYRNQIVGVKVSPTDGALPHPRSNAEVVVLFSQPNSSDIGCLLFPAPEVLQRMANDLRVDVYTYDYSGYGYSTGVASEMSIYADIQAVYDHIRRTRPHARILLIGFSLGTTASVHLAAQKPPKLAGVILLAAFWSGLSLFRPPKDPKEPNFWDRFRNIDRIHEIAVPVLLIHGSDDQIVPIGHSQEMYPMLKKPVAPLYVYGADHSTILSHPFTNLRMNRFLLQEADIFS